MLVILPSIVFGQNFPVHKNNSYVNDFANVIPDDKEPIIDRKIRDFRESSSIEITVVTINSLDGESVDDYTNNLFRKWGVGKKGLNNGVMVLAAIKDRKWRIEVGDGLGPWLTDGYAKSAGERILVPNFRKKQTSLRHSTA